jgi:non-heme chloroperoxidase
MRDHTITGGASTALHLVETGNPKGRPILFIHGFSQCWLAWSRQLHADLARSYRLVALDLRGHGLSGKPRDGYSDSRLWAEVGSPCEGTGHAAFWDDAPGFNQRLAAFAETL